MNRIYLNQRRVFLLCVCLVAAGAIVVTARTTARPDVKLSLTGTVQRGDKSVPLEEAGLISPGEIISYAVIAQNAGTAPALALSSSTGIPQGTVYVIGSARADGSARIVYSIDGGKTFHAAPMIEQRQPDGTIRQVPAPASMYTQVRCELSEPLPPGATATVTYQVQVR
ncbi:MAG TPA: hypothetical protein VNQ79_13390 [Blastocatellia bacterium]|nr:hypothetical protein [Blastocatellia bacterium]